MVRENSEQNSINTANTLSNRKLLCILIAISSLAVVLIVVNIFTALNDRVSINETEENAIDAEYYTFKDNYLNTTKEAERLLSQDNVDPNAVIQLYQSYIDQYWAEEEYQRADYFIYDRHFKLMSANFKEEALDELLKIDFSVFDGVKQYSYHQAIIGLASELDRPEIVAQYTPLAEKNKSAYDESYRASEESMLKNGTSNIGIQEVEDE